jgi:choline-glycine betaine transporter
MEEDWPMLRMAGGIILAIFILAIFAAIARPIFKVLAYLLVLYVAIMAAGFLLWGLMDVYAYFVTKSVLAENATARMGKTATR